MYFVANIAGEDAREPVGQRELPRSQGFWRLPRFLLRTYVRDPEAFSAAKEEERRGVFSSAADTAAIQ